MKRSILALSCCALFVLSAGFVSAMEDRPYRDGPVTDVTFIKTKPGMFNDYMKWVATVRKQVMEEEKKAGIIIDYKVYIVEPRHPSDPDIILTETFPNFATFDGLTERLDVITEKTEGSVKKATENSIDREKLREVLGSELIQELVLK